MEFCKGADKLFESENLKSETYEVRIRRLHEYCEQKIESKLVAKAVGCSVSYARRFSYEDGQGAFEKGWSTQNQNEKVSPGTRTKIMNRDSNTCLRCDSENEDELEVHHILPINQGGTNDDSNLATLCSDCHQAAHNGSKTSGKTAYSKGSFQTWIGEADFDDEKGGKSADSNQKKIFDY